MAAMNLSLKMAPGEQIKAGLGFILTHFTAFAFPRTISTRTTQGRQILVNSRAEALARFKQANYLDCRINAYSKHDIIGDPNFVFIDIDSTNKKLIDKILDARLKSINAHPTVLFTGNGYHIYQPIESICIDELSMFAKFDGETSKQFLRFAEGYLSHKKSDPNHNPSFSSCMVRIPGSINSKNHLYVQLVQPWDGNRPHIKLLLREFYDWMLKRQKKQEDLLARYSNYSCSSYDGPQQRRKWIEKNLLKTALNDYRKTTVNLILAPYLVNIRKLSLKQGTNVIQKWLELCKTERPLDFNPRAHTIAALTTAKKSGYKPMSLSTLRLKNHALYWALR